MNTIRTIIINSVFICIFIFGTFANAQTIITEDDRPWFKADLHTHHTFEEPLDKLIEKYRETGYQFLVLSTKDEMKLLNYEKHSTPEMLIVNGVEQAFLTRKKQFGHVLGFRIKKPYLFTTHWTLKEGYAKLRKKNKGAVLGVNHPHDQRWTLEDIMEAWENGVLLFELNSIDMKHGEFETGLWDEALSNGARLYATLVNDVHHFDDIDAYGYIMIRSESLTLNDINEALLKGDFYAVESGCRATPVLHRIVETDNEESLEIEAPGAARIRVIGNKGSVVGEYESESAKHPINGNESYLRVEIIDDQGRYIFTQPFFLN
ncbi:MAG: hypothetical protein ABIH66_13415 [bacterium]